MRFPNKFSRQRLSVVVFVIYKQASGKLKVFKWKPNDFKKQTPKPNVHLKQTAKTNLKDRDLKMSLDLLCLRLGEQIKIYKVKETFMLV